MKTLYAILFSFLLLFTGCSGNNDEQPAAAVPHTQATQSHQPFQSISPEIAGDMIKNNKKLLIVDVRTPQELKEGRINGSVLIPFWSVLKGQHNLPHDRPILLVCAVGGRSYAAGQALVRQQGFNNIYNLSGGMAAWKQKGMPVNY